MTTARNSPQTLHTRENTQRTSPDLTEITVVPSSLSYINSINRQKDQSRTLRKSNLREQGVGDGDTKGTFYKSFGQTVRVKDPSSLKEQ